MVSDLSVSAQFAIFISGSPPLKLEGNNRVVAQLADEVGTVIRIPTFHIFGCDDAFLGGAVALYNVCDPENATMFDHGLGHIVPRDAENVRMLADILGELIPNVEKKYKEKKEKASTSRRGLPEDSALRSYPHHEYSNS